MPVTQGGNLYKIGPNKFMGGGRGGEGGGGKGELLEEGCVLFGMHFSQSKNACLLISLFVSIALLCMQNNFCDKIAIVYSVKFTIHIN